MTTQRDQMTTDSEGNGPMTERYSLTSGRERVLLTNLSRELAAVDGSLLARKLLRAITIRCDGHMVGVAHVDGRVKWLDGPVRTPKARCPECGRVFDLADPNDADEWANGHDCES